MDAIKIYLSKLFYRVAIFWWVTWSKVYRWVWQEELKCEVSLDKNLSFSKHLIEKNNKN